MPPRPPLAAHAGAPPIEEIDHQLTASAHPVGDAPAEAAPAEPDDPFGLTPRERQVLTLVARGATNRQIGAQLFMAEKTASVHVSHILGKLGVPNRATAGARARELGLAQAVPNLLIQRS